jgi:nitroreductase
VELLEAMRTTFSARVYTGEDISDRQLFDILDNARFAPSGGNRQGSRVIVVRDGETKRAIAHLAEPAAKRYVAQTQAGESPWNSISPPGVSPETIAATPVPPMLIEAVVSASVVLVFLVDLKVVASIDQHLDRVGVVAGASIYPFVWNVLLATRAAGFGGTITTLATAAEPEMKVLLNIPDEHALCAVVPIGKPVKQLTKLKRKPVEETCTREKFDGEAFTVAPARGSPP